MIYYFPGAGLFMTGFFVGVTAVSVLLLAYTMITSTKKVE